jgi:hypothetical protein
MYEDTSVSAESLTSTSMLHDLHGCSFRQGQARGGLTAFSADGTRITRGLSPQVYLGRDVSTGLGRKLVRIWTCAECGDGPQVLELARQRRTRQPSPEEHGTYIQRNE